LAPPRLAPSGTRSPPPLHSGAAPPQWLGPPPMEGRWRMEVRVEGKCGPVVKNVDEVLRQVQQQLLDQQAQWLAQLRDHPARFADLEVRIHQTFQGLAD